MTGFFFIFSKKTLMKSKCFITFLDSRIAYLEQCGRIGTSLNYLRAKSSLLRFLGGKPLKISDITPAFVEKYSDWLMSSGMKRNSASFYLRILRAVFNKAVRMGLAKQSSPFQGVYTGVDTTRKRSVNCEIVRKLMAMNFEPGSGLEMSRDLFLFSLYSRGMSFVDMAFLKKSNVSQDTLEYVRRKTGQPMRVHLEPMHHNIMKKYRDTESQYIFPVMKDEDYRDYTRHLSAFNYYLGKISELMESPVKLTSYTARHTWATLARNRDVPLAVISAALGHNSESTTRIYLASLENEVVDKANKGLIDSLA